MMQQPEDVIGYFGSTEALRKALRAAREAHLSDYEVYLPVGDAVTLDELYPGTSPVRWVGLAGGAIGVVFGLGLTIWTSLDYPLITGGKPLISLPPFLVVTFEVMILCAALGVVAGFLWLARLPRLRPSSDYSSRLAVDTFALRVRCLARGVPERAEAVLRGAGALEIRRVRPREGGLLGEPHE